MSEEPKSPEFWARAYRILLTAADEVASSVATHGDQGHLPDGTGPGKASPFSDPGQDRKQLADSMRFRTKTASQNEGGDGTITWEHILTEEWAEAIAEDDPVALRAELIQVIAVAVKWVEAIDRRAGE
jgi:hypothetical protein